MNAKIKWIEDQKMLGESGTGHSVVMDALDSGKGVSPMEMFLLGIGGCTSLDVLSILKKSRQDVVEFEVQVEAEREQTHPRIFYEVRVHYVIKGRKIQCNASGTCDQTIHGKILWCFNNGWTFRGKNEIHA